MPYPKITFIISVYKDTESLGFILESLKFQTVLPDEIIISEDGDSIEMRDFMVAYTNYPIKLVHLTQEDDGWRKNIAMNNAIRAANNEYLIFIDGDCVPYSTFIQGHLDNAQHKIVLCGKRFELGVHYATKMRKHELSLSYLEKNFLWLLPAMIADHGRHLEDGVYLKAGTILSNMRHKDYVHHIIGCNWSCYKEDILAINGFDETYRLPSEGEDVDLSWRFRGMGIELKSCRNNANMIHHYHKKRFNMIEININRTIMKKHQDQNIFYCKNGINKRQFKS